MPLALGTFVWRVRGFHGTDGRLLCAVWALSALRRGVYWMSDWSMETQDSLKMSSAVACCSNR